MWLDSYCQGVFPQRLVQVWERCSLQDRKAPTNCPSSPPKGKARFLARQVTEYCSCLKGNACAVFLKFSFYCLPLGRGEKHGRSCWVSSLSAGLKGRLLTAPPAGQMPDGQLEGPAANPHRSSVAVPGQNHPQEPGNFAWVLRRVAVAPLYKSAHRSGSSLSAKKRH